MAGAPTALTVEIAARAVADAAYPSGFVPNVVLPSGLPGHRPAAEFFRAQGRAQGRAHGRAQGQRLAERAALAARDARRHARSHQARDRLTDADRLFGLSILRHHGARIRKRDPRGAAHRSRQQAALAAATAAGGPDAAADALQGVQTTYGAFQAALRELQSLAPDVDAYELLGLAVAGPAPPATVPAVCSNCGRVDYSWSCPCTCDCLPLCLRCGCRGRRPHAASPTAAAAPGPPRTP